jgi:hypothetical protein
MIVVAAAIIFSVLNYIFQIIEIGSVIQFGFSFACCNTSALGATSTVHIPANVNTHSG